ncbi:MAG: MBL fold metallo-hydrolase [Geminicoccaceae bacterium]
MPTSVYGRRERDSDGSAIFVFEVAGLRIAHLGHLHQPITDQLLAELGTIDVALVPIDGVWTMPQEEMLAAARRIGASVPIPMHYPNQGVLRHFLALTWDTTASRDPSRPVTLSRASLPRRPTVPVLRSECRPLASVPDRSTGLSRDCRGRHGTLAAGADAEEGTG